MKSQCAMSLPRWLLLTLLGVSTFSVLAAGAWWWVTWPERTATSFVSAIRTGDFAEAATFMCRGELAPGYDWEWLHNRLRLENLDVQIDRACTADLLNAQGTFGLSGVPWTFSVDRGSVSIESKQVNFRICGRPRQQVLLEMLAESRVVD
jgi:hypothetical protein